MLPPDLENIGARKPVGFIALAGRDPTPLVHECAVRGLIAIVLRERETIHYSGALYACDAAALGAVIEYHRGTLHAAGWPVDPEGFMRRIAAGWVQEKTRLFDAVADAFGDRGHPGRTDVPVPAHDDRYQPRYLEMLRALEEKMKGVTESASRDGYTPR